MKTTSVLGDHEGRIDETEKLPDLLAPLLAQSVIATHAERPTVVVGELIAIAPNGTPLVQYPGQPGQAAIAARSIVDLHAAHVGRHLLLMFESGGDGGPIVAGVLRGENASNNQRGSDGYEVEADGTRLVISARKQLVLRCGLASITLTNEGKVLIDATYLSSRSSGVHRIKGGSVQIN